jgi:aryl-alcohol dehydrogenase-like predicted oxidoreductase
MGVLSEKQVIDTVHAALDCGMTFIDTAEGYRTSEALLGKALKGRRGDAFLATKLTGEHSMAHMNSAIESSLLALQTDHVDLYQLHSPHPADPIQQTMEGLLRLKEQGKIRYIGVSNFSAAQHAEALQYGHVDSSQPQYSMFVRTAEESVLPSCEAHGTGVIVHSPLAKGLLTGRYRPDHRFLPDDERSVMAGFQGQRFAEALSVAARLKEWAESREWSLVQLAVAWTLSHSAVTSCIVGAKTPEQVLHNVEAAQWALTQDDLREIDRIQGDYRLQSLR